MRLQESDLIVLQAARTVESALVTVLYRLQQLELLIADARISIEHLNFMWSSIVSYAKSSSEATQTITDTISLLTFERRFKFVSAPWEHVVKNSKQLLNIFDEAEKIIAADYPK
jgi:leucyl aminopeptidase (aminopeptidase T)